MMMKMLVMIVVALGVAGCITTGRDAATQQTGRVFLGSQDRGPGLYIINVSEEMSTNEPHLRFTGVTTNIDISITVVNGYEKQVLLRVPDLETFAINDITCYDQEGKEIMSTVGEGRIVWWPPYHRRYENLMGRLGVNSNGLLFCCCATQPWRLRRQLEFRSDIGIPETDVGRLFVPDETHSVHLTLAMGIEYVVAGDPRWYKKDVEIRVRLERSEGGQPQGGGYSPPVARSAQTTP